VRPLGLRSLLVGITVGLSVGAVLAVGLLSLGLLQKLADGQALARVRLAGTTAAELVWRSGHEVETSARLLSERPTLQGYVRAGDDAALGKFLDRFAATGGLAGCAALRDGRAVAGGDPAIPWADVAREAEGAEGEWFVLGEPVAGDLVLVAVSPVDPLPGVHTAAALRLDETFVADLARRVGLAVAVIASDTATARLDDPRAELRAGALGEVAQDAARLDEAGAFVAAEALRDRSGTAVGLIETALDTSAADEPVRRMGRVLAVLILAVSGAAALLALLVARRIVGPLESLTEASARIGRGDLVSSIPRAAGAEVGVLASTMEEMRNRLLTLTAELRRRRAEAEAILGGIAEGVFSVDRERRITWLNPQGAALLGIAAEQAIGKFCGDVLEPESVGGIRPCEDRCPILDARFRGKARATETVGAEGRRRTVVIASTQPDSGPPDIEVDTPRQLQVMRDETEEEAVRRLRDAVLANVSHEFRTPLAAQLASLEMLRERVRELGSEDLDELVRSVERAAQRLTRLIDNMLESLRIEAGRDTIRRQRVDLDQVVEEAVELTASLILQKKQHLDVELPWPVPRMIGDAPRLTQVFVNLLANANKFAPAGSSIRMGGSVGETEVAVWVEDHGPGFPEDVGEQLFERFLRAPADEPAESGMGLGLWIVNSIVTRHGGRVDARNTGAGARVTVFLPRAHGDEDPGR